MTATARMRGHLVSYDEQAGEWRHHGGPLAGLVVADPLRCTLCGMLPTAEGHDPCLGTLDGVTQACCGHGQEPGYVRRHSETGPRPLP